MKNKAGKTCVIYCRVSSSDQIEGTSLKTQEQVCREYAARNNLEVLEVFIEEGQSAKTADRTKLIEAMAFYTSRQNHVDVFLYHKLDRSARHVEDYYSIRAMLRRSGTALVSATEPIDDSPTGKLMETMLAGIAEFDNSVRTERTKAGMLARLRQGFWSWKPPLGYHRPNPKANIAPDPATAPFILYAFREFARGFVTYRALAGKLNALGFRTPSGKPISYQTVEKIIKNPLYRGMMRVWGEHHQGSFDPIVPEALWYQCEARYSQSTVHSKPRAANNPLFPLRKLVRCGSCDDPLTGSCSTNRHGHPYAYYHHWRKGCPVARSVPKRELEEKFLELLRGCSPTSEALQLLKLVCRDVSQENAATLRAEARSIDRELTELTRERQRIFELHRSGV